MIVSWCYYLVLAGCEVMYGKMDTHYRIEGNNLCNSTSWKKQQRWHKNTDQRCGKENLVLQISERKKEKLRKCQESLRLTKGSQDTSIKWRKELEELEQ